MLRKTLLGVMAVAVVAFAAPSMAQATTLLPAPSLPSGVHPAHIADTDGNPVSAHAEITGSVTIAGAVDITCDVHARINFDNTGVSDVTDFTVTPCIVQGPAGAVCSATLTATNLYWGNRLAYGTSPGGFRDYVNVSFNLTLSGASCPAAGTYPETGTLFPDISLSGGGTSFSMTFTTSTGTVSGPLGSATFSGVLSGALTSDEADSLQLVATLE